MAVKVFRIGYCKKHILLDSSLGFKTYIRDVQLTPPHMLQLFDIIEDQLM